MPSPFPGMDPYLEWVAIWPDLHHELISLIRLRLNDVVRPRYVARVEERVYVSDDGDPGHRVYVPDVALRAASWRPMAKSSSASHAAVTAEPVEMLTVFDEQMREARVEIRDVADKQIVTVIEVLSPTNKIRGSAGRRSYLEKRSEILSSTCHLVEIDLLREGEGIPLGSDAPGHDYLVHVSHADRRPVGSVWPILLTQRLPRLAIPLKGEDEADLDLQAVLNDAYDRAGYEYDLDYTKPPSVVLTPEQAAWADRWLQEKGVR